MYRQFHAQDYRDRPNIGVLDTCRYSNIEARPDGSTRFEFQPMTIRGWLPPNPEIDSPDDRMVAVTTDPDGYERDLGNFSLNDQHFNWTGVGAPLYVPCQVCYDTSWGEGKVPAHYTEFPNADVFYQATNGRVIQPCLRCRDILRRNEMYSERYGTIFPTVEMQVRYHLRGLESWNKGWVFRHAWTLGPTGETRTLDIGNCPQCGIAGWVDNVCEECGIPTFPEGTPKEKEEQRRGLRRLPHLNHHGWVVHPCIVAHFCGHHRPNVYRPPQGPILPNLQNLFEWLRYDRCTVNRPTLRDMSNPERPIIENSMTETEVALFRLILEWNGDEMDHSKPWGVSARSFPSKNEKV